MIILSFAPAVLGFLLLTLHFFRSDNLPAMALSSLLIFLIFIRRPWASSTLQVFLLLGSAEWIRTTVMLIMARNAMGEPFRRVTIILGTVALFTALASLVFRTTRIRTYFKQITVVSMNEKVHRPKY